MESSATADGEQVSAVSTPVTMYTTRFCPYCIAACRLLDRKGVAYENIPVDGDAALRAKMTAAAGQRTVPQIWIGDTHVGGYTDLAALETQGQLDALLGVSPANT